MWTKDKMDKTNDENNESDYGDGNITSHVKTVVTNTQVLSQALDWARKMKCFTALHKIILN